MDEPGQTSTPSSTPEQTSAPSAPKTPSSEDTLREVRETARRMGRATKLTDKVQEVIVRVVRDGNYANVAARFAGISDGSYYLWLKKADEARAKIEAGERLTPNERRYVNFSEAIRAAESESEIFAVGKVRAAFDNGATALEFLSRRHGRRWSRTDRHEIVDVTKLSTEELLALDQILAKAGTE